MSTTVSYKGQTLTTVSNDTKTLLTEGTYLEDDLTLVDVSGGGSTLITKSISANGTYNASSDSADGYSQVNVAVPASAVDTGTKNITANGNNQDVVGYAAVNVAVPNSYSAGDEGKVVSNGALVAQTAHADVMPTTSDQTIDTTTNNSIKVKGDADLIATNIKKDVEIFGVTGSYEGGGGVTPTGFVSEKVINTTEGVTSGSNNSLSLMQTLEPELLENGNRAFYLFFFLDNELTNKKALFAWCVRQNDNPGFFYGSCRMNTGGTIVWIQANSHDFWYSAGTEIHILKFNSQLGA